MTKPTDSNVTPLRGLEAAPAAGRVPPHTHEAEQALLGAVLMNNRAYSSVAGFLKPEHFSDPANGVVFQAMGALIQQGQVADVVTMKSLFERDPGLASIGGLGYLARLVGSVITVFNATDYGRAILEGHTRRLLIAAGEEIINRAYSADSEADAHKQVEIAEGQLFAIGQDRPANTGAPVLLARAAEKAVAFSERVFRGEVQPGISYGLVDLDKATGGMLPGEFIIVGGRPRHGKSSLAYGVSKAIAEVRGPVAFFGMEMDHEQMAQRAIAHATGIGINDQLSRSITAEQIQRMDSARKAMEGLPIYFVDRRGISVAGIRSESRRIRQRAKGLAAIVVDYLQLMQPAGARRSNENREQEVSGMSRGLKILAGELGVPLIALSQLSRALEARDNKRPQLTDLRESGSLEQDADVVLLVWRPELYVIGAGPVRKPNQTDVAWSRALTEHDQQIADTKNIAEIVVAKQRRGADAIVQAYFDGPRMAFTNLARGPNNAAMPAGGLEPYQEDIPL